jgi:hypothetical protein
LSLIKIIYYTPYKCGVNGPYWSNLLHYLAFGTILCGAKLNKQISNVKVYFKVETTILFYVGFIIYKIKINIYLYVLERNYDRDMWRDGIFNTFTHFNTPNL